MGCRAITGAQKKLWGGGVLFQDLLVDLPFDYFHNYDGAEAPEFISTIFSIVIGQCLYSLRKSPQNALIFIFVKRSHLHQIL